MRLSFLHFRSLLMKRWRPSFIHFNITLYRVHVFVVLCFHSSPRNLSVGNTWNTTSGDKSCYLPTGCPGDRDPRLQPDDIAAGRRSHCHSSPNEAFLPQLRVPAPPTAFLSVASPPTPFHRAVLHSWPRGASRLLQHPYDAAEWTGGRKDRNTYCFFAR